MSSTTLTAANVALRDDEFDRVRTLLYDVSGIDLKPGKEGLVRSRLAKRLRELGLESYDEYVDFAQADTTGAELADLVDRLTTNKTNFFRESAHFDFMRSTVFPALARRGGEARIWSAGCSTGEEPYTLSMLAREHLPSSVSVRILATDISARVLATARAGVYERANAEDVPAALRAKAFAPAPGTGEAGRLRVVDAVRAPISFARLNLMSVWPMKGPFDAIFCRNVMIYFDKATQQKLVRRYHELLAPGGFLFVGHSESLTALDHPFAYVQPAVYLKAAGGRA